MPQKKKKANVRGNKGGCKVGRKDESPKGGCKIGKRDPNKTEKTAAMMAAFQASRKKKVAAEAKSKSAAAVGVKAGDKVKFKKKAKKSEPTEYKRKVKVGTSDRTTRSAPEAKGVMKDKAAKKARIQAKVRDLGKAQIAKKKEKKKDFTAKPKPKGIVLQSFRGIRFHDPERKARTARANKDPAFLESNAGKHIVDVEKINVGGKSYYRDDQGQHYEYGDGKQEALRNPKKVSKPKGKA